MAALSPITMMREPSMIMVIVLSALLATPAQTRNVSRDNYSIMVPERGTEPKQKVSKQKVSKQKVSNQKVSKQEQPKPRPAPKYKSDRTAGEYSQTENCEPAARERLGICVRSTDRADVSPGRGIETFQDRATRCTHQAGVYGQTGGARGSYMGSCL
jgi:hypothetical protein